MNKSSLYLRIFPIPKSGRMGGPLRLLGTCMLMGLMSMTLPQAMRPAGGDHASGKTKEWKLINAFPNLTFERPVEFTHAGDGSNRLFVLEQEGRIRVFANDPGVQSAPVYLDIKHKVSSEGEMGLLGLAFHPQFRQNGYFYVYYTKRNPLESVLARYQVASPGQAVADPATETVLLRFAQPYDNHNGGKIAFGPEGYLYISTGDGGAWGDPHQNAQNRASPPGWENCSASTSTAPKKVPTAFPRIIPGREMPRWYWRRYSRTAFATPGGSALTGRLA
ncbi:PQQ-dependent sugar dehydrogenase [Salmonirosea aquatica]|uniref:PQQ-dependent sugar dehydrogenase n=1 Tax=Salmonirosea aquatica TaxID=2654236 RepID=UPI0035711BBF